MKQIKFTKGYKYQLEELYFTQTDITGYDIDTDFIQLSQDGALVLRKGFAWDGPSGPTIDTPNFMRGSAEHDAFYKLMRMELLPLEEREKADIRLKETCLEDGMSEFRAGIVFDAVRKFASSAAEPKNKKEVFVVP